MRRMIRALAVVVASIWISTVFLQEDAEAQQAPLDPAIASLVALINAHDVEGLVQRVRFVPQPCNAEPQGIDQPEPQCPAGFVPGTLVDTFLTASCGGYFVTGPNGARRAIEERVQQFPATYVYDVLSGPGIDARYRPQVQTLIISNEEGAHQGLLWYVTADGMLDAILTTCSQTAQQSTEHYIGRGLTSSFGLTLPSTGIPSEAPTTGSRWIVLAVLSLIGGAVVSWGLARR